MKLTKKKALKICEELWFWLEKTGGRHKYEWKGWIKYKDMRNNCPACEYNVQHSDGRCMSDCILASIWVVRHCENEGSLYREWHRSKAKKDRKKYATIIWKGIRKIRRSNDKTTGN